MLVRRWTRLSSGYSQVLRFLGTSFRCCGGGEKVDASELRYFVSSALPFGAVAAVSQFNRVGEALSVQPGW
eukprot:5757985-Amphidinium_carterae.2